MLHCIIDVISVSLLATVQNTNISHFGFYFLLVADYLTRGAHFSLVSVHCLHQQCKKI